MIDVWLTNSAALLGLTVAVGAALLGGFFLIATIADLWERFAPEWLGKTLFLVAAFLIWGLLLTWAGYDFRFWH